MTPQEANKIIAEFMGDKSMTLKEFRKRVEKAHKLLDKSNKGVCHALSFAGIIRDVNKDSLMSFDYILRPRCLKTGKYIKGVDGEFGYWLGDLTKENLPLRHHFIDVWAGICESEKWYRSM